MEWDEDGAWDVGWAVVEVEHDGGSVDVDGEDVNGALGAAECNVWLDNGATGQGKKDLDDGEGDVHTWLIIKHIKSFSFSASQRVKIIIDHFKWSIIIPYNY